MIAALLVPLALADEPATYERLFGDPPAATTETVPPAEPAPWGMVGAVALAGVGLLALWRLRKSGPHGAAGRPLEILGRYPLGDRNALVLVEVVDGDGERRRLLIGTGTGAPTLVSDLGSGAMPSVVDEVLAERRPDFRRGAVV